MIFPTFLLRRTLAVLTLFSLAACGPEAQETPSFSANVAAAGYVEGELLVGVRTGEVRAAAAGDILPGARETGRVDLDVPARPRTAAAGEEEHGFAPVTVLRLALPAGLSVEAALERLRGTDAVLYAEPNYRVRRAGIPDDLLFDKQWGLRNTGQTLTGNKGTVTGTAGADIRAPLAWDVTTGSPEMVVGVIDSGIDYDHPDLAANIWHNPGESGFDSLGRDKGGNGVDDDGNGYVDDVRGWNFISNNNRPLDDDVDGHGTHVAGTIGAIGDNGAGVAGINWQVRLIPLKFLDRYGNGDLFNAVAAYNYAVRNGARVINASYTYPQSCTYTTPSQAERDAIAAARAAGVLVIAAAGNFGCNNDLYPFYPGSHPLDNILSVTGTDPNDGKITWSNYGPASVDLGAPGLNIYSTVRQTLRGLDGAYGYDYLSGTSMAAPHVAGAAALLWSWRPGMLYGEVRDRLLTTVDPVAALTGRTVAGGRLNLATALADLGGAAPAAPADLQAGQTISDTVQLIWRDLSDNESAFVVERQTADGSFVIIGQVPADTTAFTDPTPLDGRSNVYRVKATAAGLASPYSNEAALVVPLRAPANLTAAASGMQIRLAWQELSGAETEVLVERKAANEEAFSLVARLDPDTSTYADASARAQTFYLYRVLVRNAQTGNSAYSNEALALIPIASSCFIATAAWGTPLAPEVEHLRRFRDRVLLPTRAGRAFVAAYYRWSPPVAACIGRHEGLRTAVRFALGPVAWLAGKVVPAEASP